MMKTFLILMISILATQSCSVFEKDEKVLAEHQRNNGEKIKIIYVSLGATTNDVIQIRKGNQDTVIKVIENYDTLEKSELINDTVLQLILNNAGMERKPDTFSVIVK